MSHEKLTSAIESAIHTLKDSAEAVIERDEKRLDKLVWRASAELEYALFLFSILHPRGVKPPRTLDPKSKSLEIGPTLVLVQNLLEEAKENLNRKEVAEAYRKAWTAREHLLKLQGRMEKQRKQEKSR